MKTIKIVASVVLSCVVAGCGSKGGDAAADRRPGDTTEFEMAKDPAVSPETRFAAGQYSEAQNELGKAIDQYKQAVKSKPDFQPALYRLGVLYTQLKMYPDAVDAWKGYIKATGDAAGGYSNLGFTYQISGDDVSAEGAYKTGIAKDPRNRPCRVNYGLLLARQGKFDSTIAQWQTVLTAAEVHYNLASVHELRGDKAQARVEYQKALELDPRLNDAKAKLSQLDKD